MNTNNQFCAQPFWQDGPAPGALYNFPNIKNFSSMDGKQHSQSPVTTSSSVVAFQFKDGVIMAGDLLASYGSLARYRNCPRLLKVNDQIILGASGDYADFQYLKDIVSQKVIDDECLDDGFSLKPKSLYCWLTRIMYNRRNKFDPLWNNLVVAGIQDNVPFLGTVDKLGTAFEDKAICTGFGAHIALPIIRRQHEKNPSMNLEEAKQLVEKCMEVLFYRDARSFPKYQLAVVTKDGVALEDSLDIKQNWALASMISN